MPHVWYRLQGAIVLTILLVAASAAVSLYPAASCNLSLDAATWTRHPWQILTYSMVHASGIHALWNILWVACGAVIMSLCGHRGAVIGTFALASVCGALAYLTSASGHGILVGASAGALGLLSADLVLMAGQRRSLAALAMGATVCLGISLSGGHPTVHIAGVLTGVAYGIILEAIRRRHCARQATIRLHADELAQLTEIIRLSGFRALSAAQRQRYHQLTQK